MGDISIFAVFAWTIFFIVATVFLYNCWYIASYIARYHKYLEYDIAQTVTQEELENVSQFLVGARKNTEERQISKDHWDECIARIRKRNANHFGQPGAHIFKFCLSESTSFLGSSRAVILQAINPLSSRGVTVHSAHYRLGGPLLRLEQTLKYMNPINYGSVEECVRHARIIRRLHDKVNGSIEEDMGPFEAGTKYNAHFASGLLWVAATLVESSTLLHRLLINEMSMEELEMTYKGGTDGFLPFGLCADDWPATYRLFLVYLHVKYSPLYYFRNIDKTDPNGIVSDTFVSQDGLDLIDRLFVTDLWYQKPLIAHVKATSSFLLPPFIRSLYNERMREKYGCDLFPDDWLSQLAAVSGLALFRTFYWCLPRYLRSLNGYKAKLKRERHETKEWRLYWRFVDAVHDFTIAYGNFCLQAFTAQNSVKG